MHNIHLRDTLHIQEAQHAFFMEYATITCKRKVKEYLRCGLLAGFGGIHHANCELFFWHFEMPLLMLLMEQLQCM